jgi:hypothetical protein
MYFCAVSVIGLLAVDAAHTNKELNNNNSIQFFNLMCCTNSQTANYRYSTNKQNNNNKDKMLITT